MQLALCCTADETNFDSQHRQRFVSSSQHSCLLWGPPSLSFIPTMGPTQPLFHTCYGAHPASHSYLLWGPPILSFIPAVGPTQPHLYLLWGPSSLIHDCYGFHPVSKSYLLWGSVKDWKNGNNCCTCIPRETRRRVQREAQDSIIIIIVTREGELEQFTAPQVPRRCPLVL